MGLFEARSLAALLGVKAKRGRAVDTLELAQEIEKGLSVAAVDRLCSLVAARAEIR